MCSRNRAWRDLFSRIVETAPQRRSHCRTQNGRGNGQPGQANASDELAGIGFSPEGIPEGPVDPRLRTSAEGEVQASAHDLPLTVNDQRARVLEFFLKDARKGRAIVETGLRRAGRYRAMIQRVLRERACRAI